VPERRWPTHQDLIVCPQEDAEAFASPQDGRERRLPILKAAPPAVEEWSNPMDGEALHGAAATSFVSSPGALRCIGRIACFIRIGTHDGRQPARDRPEIVTGLVKPDVSGAYNCSTTTGTDH
jgi:hypothetical protein